MLTEEKALVLSMKEVNELVEKRMEELKLCLNDLGVLLGNDEVENFVFNYLRK